jgi:hypothetical protein
LSQTAIVWSCAHTDPEVSNKRFDWLGDLIEDVKPDYVVDLGDGADMKSLNSYDTRYPQAIVAQSYERDIEHYNEAMDRLWGRYRISKKKRPTRIGFEGNHENRITKAINLDPRLEGAKYGVSFKHLQTDHWFDEYHRYENSAPAIAAYDGVSYAHFFSSGNYGNAMSGLHHAYSLVQNRHNSSVCGHSHKRSVYFKDEAYPNPSIGLVVGCYKGKEEAWAGQSQNSWWKGVVILREVEDGSFNPQFVSLRELQKSYG